MATEINPSPLLQVSETCIRTLESQSSDALSKDQLDANQATMKMFQANGSDLSDTDMSCTDEEGEYVTVEELAICAQQVEKMLRRISKVQKSLQSHKITAIQRKRHIRKIYQRFRDGFESGTVGLVTGNASDAQVKGQAQTWIPADCHPSERVSFRQDRNENIRVDRSDPGRRWGNVIDSIDDGSRSETDMDLDIRPKKYRDCHVDHIGHFYNESNEEDYKTRIGIRAQPGTKKRRQSEPYSNAAKPDSLYRLQELNDVSDYCNFLSPHLSFAGSCTPALAKQDADGDVLFGLDLWNASFTDPSSLVPPSEALPPRVLDNIGQTEGQNLHTMISQANNYDIPGNYLTDQGKLYML